jgi:hypothetical protein
MQNPWADLPNSAPYVLASDSDAVRNFNRSASDRCSPDLHIHLELLPEPFIGSPNACVVLLNLNPVFSENDIYAHGHPLFIASCRANLEHAPSQYPFYLLDPNVHSPGGDWWAKRLGHVIRATSQTKVASNVACIEYLGYHSRRFSHQQVRVPSMEYGFELVRQAISRDALILIMRSEKLWKAAVPELADHRRLFSLRNPRNVTISPRNCPEGFGQIVGAIESA